MANFTWDGPKDLLLKYGVFRLVPRPNQEDDQPIQTLKHIPTGREIFIDEPNLKPENLESWEFIDNVAGHDAVLQNQTLGRMQCCKVLFRDLDMPEPPALLSIDKVVKRLGFSLCFYVRGLGFLKPLGQRLVCKVW